MFISKKRLATKALLMKHINPDSSRETICDELLDNDDIVIYFWDHPNKTIKNRLNVLWAFPLTLILCFPRWVLLGRVGWTTKTVMGRFILKSVGEYKDD